MTHALRLYGHRGACAECPENTMLSFERAVEIGVDVLETDVHMTADRVIVVSHDPDGGRSARVAGAIARSTFADIQAWDIGWGFRDRAGSRPFAGGGCTIPRLDDVLGSFDVRFNIDIKQGTPSMVEPLLALLRRHDAEQRVTLASFDGSVIRAVRKSGYRGETVLARDEVLALWLAPRVVGRWFAGDAVQVPVRAGPIDFGGERFIARCHALGLRVDYWTVNDPIAAEVLLERGADGIISDDPRALLRLFGRFRANHAT